MKLENLMKKLKDYEKEVLEDQKTISDLGELKITTFNRGCLYAIREITKMVEESGKSFTFNKNQLGMILDSIVMLKVHRELSLTQEDRNDIKDIINRTEKVWVELPWY